MKRDLQAKVLSQYGEQELTENQFIVAYLRLLQLAAHPMLVGETRIDLTPKSERLLQLVEDSGEQSVIVWSNWPDIIDWLAAAIQSKGISCLPVHGGTSKEKRIQAKDSFMAGETRVLVANPGVWGEGVNLQKASIMIDHDYHPSLSRWKQSRARAHRMGQTLPVTNYRLFHSSSIEVQVLDWLEEKVRLSTIITGDNKK
jgi:SNF2 family DNA or RNA helicase